MTALFQRFARRIALGDIPCLYLILLISLPVWTYVSLSNTFLSTVVRQYLQSPAPSTIGPRQHLLQNALLYPLLLVCYWMAIWSAFSRTPISLRISTQLVLAVVFSGLAYPMLYVAAFATGSLHLTGPDLQMLIHDPFTRTYWAAVTITYGAPYFFGLFLIVSATLLVRLQNEMRMRSELDKQYFETRLETLRGQLGPHFLSNALNTALAFVRHDPDKAEQAITGLNHLLRAGFEITPKHIVSLRKELSYVNHYLTIMKLRFEDMLDIAISVPDEILDCLIPDFLLVTLLENAFKHGGPSSSGRMTIDLTITSGSQDLLIRIENSLALEGSSSKMGWGVGLRNTRDRLSVLYGDDYHMDGGLSRPNHWQVKIRLPLIPGEP